MLAGVLSSWGFSYCSDFLEARMGLKDTCGVHNLHGMPGVFGGLVPVLVLLRAHEHSAALAQLMAVAATLAVATMGGVLCALLVDLLPNENSHALQTAVYEDSMVFEGEDEE